MTVAALASEVVLVLVAFGHPGEAGAQADQLADHLGTVAHDRLDGGAVAQPGAGAQGVLDMRFERIVHAPDAGDPALRVGGVGVGAAGLDQHRDAAARRGLQCEAQTGDPAADYQKVAGDMSRCRHSSGCAFHSFTRL